VFFEVAQLVRSLLIKGATDLKNSCCDGRVRFNRKVEATEEAGCITFKNRNGRGANNVAFRDLVLTSGRWFLEVTVEGAGGNESTVGVCDSRYSPLLDSEANLVGLEGCWSLSAPSRIANHGSARGNAFDSTLGSAQGETPTVLHMRVDMGARRVAFFERLASGLLTSRPLAAFDCLPASMLRPVLRLSSDHVIKIKTGDDEPEAIEGYSNLARRLGSDAQLPLAAATAPSDAAVGNMLCTSGAALASSSAGVLASVHGIASFTAPRFAVPLTSGTVYYEVLSTLFLK